MASYGAINECAEGVSRGSAQAGQVRRIFFGVAVLAAVAIGAVLNLNHISSQVPQPKGASEPKSTFSFLALVCGVLFA